MNKDITVSITQNNEPIITATISQCGGAPASEYLAVIKLLSNQISGELNADIMDIDLTLDYALSDRAKITKLISSAATTGKFACAGCLALASVEMPNLITVGDYGFARCPVSGEFSDTFGKVETIGLSAFDRCKFESVDLSAVKVCGARAFRAGDIKKVWLPQSLRFAGPIDSALDAPFISNADVNVMIYTDCPDETTAREIWGQFFDNVGDDVKAPVLYGETHAAYMQD